MKHLKSSLAGILLLAFVFSTSLKAQQNKAVPYMEKIGRELNAIMVDSWEYTSEVAHGKSARKAETKRKELVRTSKLAMDRISRMNAFGGSSQYRDSVVSFLWINYNVLKEDYEKILNMEEVAEQSYDRMEAYLLAQELADEKLDSASDRMLEQQRLFAANNHINLLENKDKVAKKLEKAGGVLKYYHQVYLVFFKCYKQEAYLIAAMNKKDVNAMEQNKNALAAASNDGLEKLTNIAPYKKDKSLISACKSALGFYQSEASDKMGTIIDFFMQQENFAKIKSSIDAKPKSGRTNEDIRQYNNALREFNSQQNSFNKLNDYLNRTRSGVLNNWNNSVKSFLDKNIPRYK